MSLSSRREFLKSILPARSQSNRGDGETWERLGHCSDFPVRSVKRAVVGGIGVDVESLGQGLRAKHVGAGTYCALKIGGNGEIFIKQNEIWSQDYVLSLLTGEKYQL